MEFPPPPEAACPFSSTGRQAFPQPQLSIASCLSPYGTFDVKKYPASLLARAHGRSAAILSNMLGGSESHAAFLEKHSKNSAFKKSCGMRCVLGQKDTEDGPLCVIAPEESVWYRAYVNNFLLDEPDLFMAKKFRNRFRLPYTSYKELLCIIQSDNRFECWCRQKWNGKKTSPVEL